MYVFFLQVTSDLFDIMSGQTDIDHPLCEECTDTLLDHLDTQLSITENECQNYKLVSLTLISSNLQMFFFLILSGMCHFPGLRVYIIIFVKHF